MALDSTNRKAIVITEHRNGLTTIMSVPQNVPPNEVVEQFQRHRKAQGYPTGVDWQVCPGGIVDALIKASDIRDDPCS